MERKMPNLNVFENIVGNGVFVHYEQMLHFPQCCQSSSTTEAIKGGSTELGVIIANKHCQTEILLQVKISASDFYFSCHCTNKKLYIWSKELISC